MIRFRAPSRLHGPTSSEATARSKRSRAIRAFLSAYGAAHYAERIGEPRPAEGRYGSIVL